MIRIIDSRASGKTSRLMLLAKENNGILVCNNPYAMQSKAHAYGLTGIDFVSYNAFIAGDYDTNKPVFIDEIEIFVKQFGKVAGYTLSNED
jgi:hypothetical protein